MYPYLDFGISILHFLLKTIWVHLSVFVVVIRNMGAFISICYCFKDYEFMSGKSEYEDIIQSGGKPSTVTDRGHMSPAAFLIMASGLDKVRTM